MSEKILLEPKYVLPKIYKDRKVFFLAGPIRGGGAWQICAANRLWEKFPGCVVVDPTRWENAKKRAKSDDLIREIDDYRTASVGVKDEASYPSQTFWESGYMQLAAKTGALLFWLAKQSANSPRTAEEGVYAQDTRVELGMWIEKIHNNPNLSVKIGGDWEMDESGLETKNSFGGMNFVTHYLTGEKNRFKIYNNEVKSDHLILARSVEEFIDGISLKEMI